MDEIVFVSPRHSGEEPINAASFSPDRKLLLVASQGGLNLWEIYSGLEILEFHGHGVPRGVRDAHFSPCGTYVASAGLEEAPLPKLIWRNSFRDGVRVAEVSVVVFDARLAILCFLRAAIDGVSLSFSRIFQSRNPVPGR